jgi:hypothetical protein
VIIFDSCDLHPREGQALADIVLSLLHSMSQGGSVYEVSGSLLYCARQGSYPLRHSVTLPSPRIAYMAWRDIALVAERRHARGRGDGRSRWS